MYEVQITVCVGSSSVPTYFYSLLLIAFSILASVGLQLVQWLSDVISCCC